LSTYNFLGNLQLFVGTPSKICNGKLQLRLLSAYFFTYSQRCCSMSNVDIAHYR